MNDDILVLRRPAHSDFIVHWTGGKIAEEYNLKVNQRNLSDTVVEAYLDRLESILRYGLWMNIRKDKDYKREMGSPIKGRVK